MDETQSGKSGGGSKWWDLTKATTVGDQRVLEMNRETNNFVTETSFANGRQINF